MKLNLHQDINKLDGIQLILYPAVAMAQGEGAIKNIKKGGGIHDEVGVGGGRCQKREGGLTFA